MMKNITIKSLVCIPFIYLVISITSCSDYLNIDEYSKDLFNYDSIFQNRVNLENYLWGAANMLPDEANLFGSSSAKNNVFPGVSASDECFNQWNNSSQPGTEFVQGVITSDNIANTRMNFWPSMYKIIRKMNLIIENIHKCEELSTVDRNEILGYTYFLRAYAYYHILMNQGPVIIVEDNIYETNMDPEYYNQPRATYDESVEYICDEMERAARYLRPTVSINQLGRPTRGAAYAMIARLRLQHASPLFNGGGGASGDAGNSAKLYFGEWTRKSDGAHYINQEYDERRWALAAAAALRVIKLGTYELHKVEADDLTPELPAGMANKNTYPNGPAGIDPYRSYSDMFTGEAVPYQNKEFIWARASSVVREYTRHSFPAGNWAGYGGMAIPQKIIDAYYLRDGSDAITPGSADCPYDEEGFLTGSTTFSGYVLGGGNYGVNNMYVNREARFYASIGFSQCFWPMSSTNQSGLFNQYFGYATDDNAGLATTTTNTLDYTLTGYVTKKYVHKDDAWTGTNAVRLDKYFPIIRYAEILLSYVEALNNITQQAWTIELPSEETYTINTRDNNKEEMAEYFNLIRYRAGLPGVSDEILSSKDEMFKCIERERMLELFHEGRRYYDVRRWGVYLERDTEPIVGMDVESARDNGFYTRVRVNNAAARNRVTHRKMVFLPLSREELKKVPLMDQNYGW